MNREVYEPTPDRRQMTEEQEMMEDQKFVDFQLLRRVNRGETDHRDYLYLVGRLGYNLNQLEAT